ncbi:MAG: type VI secretion system contractile sheath large subunit [Phycisphaerae bacterium]|nr:type VI secretion system contractile sheath large subunit [Phycisphaerae bacterium]
MADRPEPPDLEVNLPLPEGLKVTGEEPYRILVLSDFAGSESGSLSGPLADRVVEVNADSFDEVMAAASPGVNYTISDPVASGNVMVEVNLRFDSVRAFAPEVLAQQIPAARVLMEMRESIAKRLGGQISASDLDGAVSQIVAADSGLSWLTESLKVPASAAEPAVPPGQVDALLDQIDLGDDASGDSGGGGKSPIGSLVSAAAGKGSVIPAGEVSALRRTLAEIDRRISLWLNAVLHSEQVQQLESTWRGLAFLIERVDFRKNVRVTLLHAPQNARVERLISLVIDPVFDEGADAPDFIAVDGLFGNSAADMETLDALAQHAASLPAVVLAGVGPRFFGVKHSWQTATLPTILNMFDQWQFAKWKTLRNEPYAKHLAVVFGRCLLRTPYEKESGSGTDFAFREQSITEQDFVWVSGSVAAACLVARSVGETGWPAAVTGLAHGTIEGLPIAHGGKKGDKQFGPTNNTQTPQPKIDEMGMAGINAFSGIGTKDNAVLCNGMTAARPQRAEPSALFEVSLPYLLFAGRLSALLWALKPYLRGMTPEKIRAFVAVHVREWLKLDKDATSGCVSVHLRESEDDPSVLELAATVTPPQTLVPGGVPVVLGYKLTPM